MELINPLDSVVNRLRIRQDKGAFCGHIPLDENLPEGDYTLCAYTENMQSLGEDFIFRNQPVSETKTGNDTMAHFSFRLPEETTPRVLTVKTVKRTRHFPIPYPTDDFEVTFYPEGGYLLQGVSGTVASVPFSL